MHALYENHYLSDIDVANYARQSFADLAKHFTVEQNHNLIKFLARGMSSGDWNTLIKKLRDPLSHEEAHQLAVYLRQIPEHWVPFGHPHITLKMCAPIPIRVQAFKHKIGYVESEESRRYIYTTPVVYVPDAFRSAAASVKQGSGGVHPDSELFRSIYMETTKNAIATYENMIACGVCPEQARFVLPQGCEVNWVWTGSLYAYANFYNQRSDPHAQKEIQELAKAVGDLIAPLYPASWAALTEGNF